jgi:hypothetical protein
MSIEENRLAPAPDADAYLCGWRLRSFLPLPELERWTGEDRLVDVVIRVGPVPARLDGAKDLTPLLQATPQGEARLCIDGVATYWLRSEREIVVDPHMPAESPDVRTFLFGTMLGLLCHRRGVFPLHASSVLIGDKAVAISGASGVGKSTLAAALTRRGHALVSDDICVIDLSARGGPVVRPAFPRVKLWQDSLDAIGVESQGLSANRLGQPKYYLRFSEAANFRKEAVPLKAVYLLGSHNAPLSGHAEIERLPPTSGIFGLHQQIYRMRTAAFWGLEADLFKSVGRIVEATDVWRLTRTANLADLEAMVTRLEAHVMS